MMPQRRVEPDMSARNELLKADWEDIGIRLTAHAVWKARNLRWRTGQPTLLAGGKTPEDVANEAMLKVIEGTRIWDAQRGPLLPFLRRIVDSLLNQLADSADNRFQQRLAPGSVADAIAPRCVARTGIPDGAQPTPSDYNEHAAVRIDQLRAALAQEHREDLLAVMDAIAFHCEPKPQDIAVYLGTTVADVNNRLKRLRRFAHKLGQPQHARMTRP
jgi:DNA-directed RNA polymerase specialized sigma24 family protein